MRFVIELFYEYLSSISVLVCAYYFLFNSHFMLFAYTVSTPHFGFHTHKYI